MWQVAPQLLQTRARQTGGDLAVHHLKGQFHHIQNGRAIVYDQYSLLHSSPSFQVNAALSLYSPVGSEKKKVDPIPSTLSIHIFPPWRWMIS